MAILGQFRGDLRSNWESVNPVIHEREFILVKDTDDGPWTAYKIGDGVSHFNDLPYASNISILQELGNSETATISQKVITHEINRIDLEHNTDMLISGDFIFEKEKTALTTVGTLVSSSTFNYFTTEKFFLINDEVSSINLKNLYGNTSATIAGIAFYKEDKTFIGYYNKVSRGYLNVKIKDIINQFTGAVCFRLCGSYPVPLLVDSYVESRDNKITLCNSMINARGEEFLSYENWDNMASCFLSINTGKYQSGLGVEGYFYVTPFIPVIGIPKVTFDGCSYNNVSMCVFYDNQGDIISQINGIAGRIIKEFDVPNDASFVRFCGNAQYGVNITAANNSYKKAIDTVLFENSRKLFYSEGTLQFLNNLSFKYSNSILNNNGNVSSHSTWGNFKVTDFLLVKTLMNYKFFNLVAWKTAQANPIAFYDKDFKVIGTAYNPASVNTSVPVNITLSEDLLVNYPNVVYVRIGIDTNYDWNFISPYTDKNTKKSEPYPSYKFNMFNKVLCGGDSVTKGFVVEGTAEQQYIYQEMPEYSYPTQLGKIHTNLNITTAAQSGINCINWLANFYPTITFSEYDLFILELGLNGSLNIADINTPGTNTYAYKQIVAGARTQNPNMIIALVRSQHFGDAWGSAIEAVASQYDCIYADLHNTDYLNLDDPIYHGYYQNGSQRDFDYAHFTRKGYNAKAYVLERLISEKLTDSTI